ncbi:MAG TPA: site-2 protease family protein [Usitatibacter sp.]|nr:site-2 protease family protein [Usitatibacter sp.]
MFNGLRLGRIAGIDIVMDWSLLIIFFLIALSLGAGLFPAWHPDWSPGLAWTTALAAAALFFASVLAHELSHALVGRSYGISIRRITLFIFGGMAHMEGQPRTWRAELAMAIVGPITSLVLGFVFLWIAGAVAGPVTLDMEEPRRYVASLGALPTLLLWLGPINILLGIFNLVPGFPLDGGRVLRAILWGATGDMVRATRWASRGGQFVAWTLIGLGFLMMLGLRVPFFGTGLVGGMWLAFIGWYLNNAALVSYRQLLVREALEDVPVERIMQTRFVRIAPELSVARLVDEHVMASGQRAFPVEQDGRFVGMVSLSDIQKRPRASWAETRVDQIMTPAASLATVSPRQDAAEAANEMASRDVNQLPVVDGTRLMGLLRREDVLKWLSLHSGGGLAGGSGLMPAE